MSDDEYSYHYSDEDDDEPMNSDEDDDNGSGSDQEDEFEYTDDEEEPQGDDMDVNLENSYYNAKGFRDTDVNEAIQTFESVIQMEREHLGDDRGDADGDGTGMNEGRRAVGQWTFKSLKQIVKVRMGCGEFHEAQKAYRRLLAVISNPDLDGVSPNDMEKGITAMLDRVSALFNSSASKHTPDAAESTDGSGKGKPQDLARLVYDSTLSLFHPRNGSCPNERLWFKTNLKYGQLLYENHETAKLQSVLRDLLYTSGLEGTSSDNRSSASSTHLMEIYALQIQLYSRLKDNKKLREIFGKAMSVQGGIPHPRTLALIQELGGKMHMASREYESACTTFFQAFKSYDEAGDTARLRCLKYLVMASMLHASSINPFDSQEVRPYKNDPEIVAMTNLVDAFHENDIKTFERILNKNEGKIMNDEFIREYISDLLRTIRKQVLSRVVLPYTRISLAALSKELNGISIHDVENLLVSLILDGKLEGRIDQIKQVLIKTVNVGSISNKDVNPAEDADAKGGKISQDTFKLPEMGADTIGIRSIDAIESLMSQLETLTSEVISAASRTPEKMHEKTGGGIGKYRS